MYRIPCSIAYIPDGSPVYVLTLFCADLPQLIALVDKIKDGSYKGVELAEKDKSVCRVSCEDGLLALAFSDVILRLNENQDEIFRLFLTDMTATAPLYDHIDLEIPTAEGRCDLTVRVEM